MDDWMKYVANEKSTVVLDWTMLSVCYQLLKVVPFETWCYVL